METEQTNAATTKSEDDTCIVNGVETNDCNKEPEIVPKTLVANESQSSPPPAKKSKQSNTSDISQEKESVESASSELQNGHSQEESQAEIKEEPMEEDKKPKSDSGSSKKKSKRRSEEKGPKRKRNKSKTLYGYRKKKKSKHSHDDAPGAAPPSLSPVHNSPGNSELGPPLLESVSRRKRKAVPTQSVTPLKRGFNGWEDSLRPRPNQADHYQSLVIIRNQLLEFERLQKQHGKEPQRLKKTDIKEIDTAPFMPHEPKVGDVVWGKLGATRWWPAIIIQGQECGQPRARTGNIWVFWFGDHKISELPTDKISSFVDDFEARYSDYGGKVFKKGVVEAIQEIADRVDKSLLAGEPNTFIAWAKEGFPSKCSKAKPFESDPARPLSETIDGYLAQIKSQYQQSSPGSSKEEIPLQPRFFKDEEGVLNKIRDGTVKIQDVCVACYSQKSIVVQHPLIEGGLCLPCKLDVMDTMFSYGEDGTNAFCVICGQAGELLICDNVNCNRCFCTNCVNMLIGQGVQEKILETNPWHCYVCTEETESEKKGLISRKDDWQQNILSLFHTDTKLVAPPVEAYQDKRPINVLSLFDGVATGKFVLDQLGIEVNTYVASEIDNDAISVTRVQHKTFIQNLGSIESLTEAKVAELCPIDLVIGGAPSADFNLANPIRKQFYDPSGSGRMFFEFFRVLSAVQKNNAGKHVFWLYENLASMSHEYKAIISRFLQCEPAMIDSKFLSAQSRPHYFWGNLPGLYTPLVPQADKDIKLDSVLTPNFNRQTTMEKLRTVSWEAMAVGTKGSLPVEMEGKPDSLWVTELEQVFGFPPHYTDTGNLGLSRRIQLLSQAWSVPIIAHLFAPLKQYFKTTAVPLVPTLND